VPLEPRGRGENRAGGPKKAAQAAGESDSACCIDDFTCHLSQLRGGLREFREGLTENKQTTILGA
jgi:hypothetical protein